MDLDALFGPNPTVVDLNAENRWEAIVELIGHLAAAHKIRADQKDGILKSILKRELSMTTGIGYGIGLPHAATDLVPELVGAVGRSSRGVQFDALDGQPVHLVFLFLVPEGEFQKHTHILAEIAKLLHTQEFRDWLRRRFL